MVTRLVSQCAAAVGEDGAYADLPAAAHEQSASAAPDLSILAAQLAIERPNRLECADAFYIPMRRGFLFLFAIMDWAARKILAWRLSNTIDADFCVAALEEALVRFGKPEIFYADHSSQFPSHAFIYLLRGGADQA